MAKNLIILIRPKACLHGNIAACLIKLHQPSEAFKHLEEFERFSSDSAKVCHCFFILDKSIVLVYIIYNKIISTTVSDNTFSERQ